MKKTILILFANVFVVLMAVTFLNRPTTTDSLSFLKEKQSKKHIPSVDHSKFGILSQDFKDSEQTTEACLTCHTERHKELLNSSHWKWEREVYIPNKGVKYIGKKNLLNNYCIGIGSNEQACTKCHPGFGWKDKSFDFADHKKIDCLICHASGGTYKKGNTMAGYPDTSVDLAASAQSVALPTKENCGSCHFFSGGGNNVKHGDLEVALLDCNHDVDVHMSIDNSNMSCTDCHKTEKHQISGKLYTVSSMNKNRATCTQCHGDQPHVDGVVNEHTSKVACQTCHIPTYAKVNATKTTWDWSQAGKLKNGKPYYEKDADGNKTYMTKKGAFTWGKNLKPEYRWFNGTADHYLLGDKMNPDSVLQINTLFGSYADNASKIIPVKVHRGKQIFDSKNLTLIQPNIYAPKAGMGAYWKDFDWQKAATIGMKHVGLEYSGEYDFVKTEMYWPINHMVSKAENAVSCKECHSRNDSRLAELKGFYMPGRDRNVVVDNIAILVIIMTIIGVLTHLIIRIFNYRKRKNNSI